MTEIRRTTRTEEAAELGAAIDRAMVDVGHRFGLYAAMADAGPVTSAEQGERTEMPWQHLRLWLTAQAACDFLSYDEATGRYSLWCARPRGPARDHGYRGDAVRRPGS